MEREAKASCKGRFHNRPSTFSERKLVLIWTLRRGLQPLRARGSGEVHGPIARSPPGPQMPVHFPRVQTAMREARERRVSPRPDVPVIGVIDGVDGAVSRCGGFTPNNPTVAAQCRRLAYARQTCRPPCAQRTWTATFQRSGNPQKPVPHRATTLLARMPVHCPAFARCRGQNCVFCGCFEGGGEPTQRLPRQGSKSLNLL